MVMFLLYVFRYVLNTSILFYLYINTTYNNHVMKQEITNEKQSYWKKMLTLFLVFLKIGAFTFGGGYAMIPIIKENIIEKRKWMDEDEMIDMVAIAESTPGPIAINIATYVGFKVGKYFGAVLSTLAVSLPSLLVIYVISLFFDQFLANQYVAYAFVGVKAAVALLISISGIEMLIKMKKKVIPLIVFISVLIAMLLLEIFSINFSSIWIILMGGVIGLFVSFYSAIKEKRAKTSPQIPENKQAESNESAKKEGDEK